ncbi:MAG: DUF423 domain-containing protein [Planctomycetia bacterium]|nr:DUF423 domain-containing protein [Planctomycetia bacterium]
MNARTAILIGALLGATGVGAGAIGSHMLANKLAIPQREQFETAVRYQLIHALALVAVGALGRGRPSRWLCVAGVTFVGGVLLFSGGLYTYIAAVTVPLPLRFAVHLVPVGGVMLIIGWLALAGSVLKE